jgi:heme o synthase
LSIIATARDSARIAGTLSKVRISLPVTATTFTGFIVYSGNLTTDLIPLLTGVFLLASGSSALNHYQEQDTDRVMERTQNRPLPRKLVSPGFVLLFSIILLASGSLILYLAFPLPVVLLGLFNVFWYNAVYTSLKKTTAFAVIPGSVTGGVPPMIGWVAAGGNWLDTSILLIFLFFVIGQIPHFWLLLLKYGKQYEKAGLPSLTSFFSDRQISRISVAWIAATLAASGLLPAHGLISNPLMVYAYIIIASLFFMIIISPFIFKQIKDMQGLQFLALNLFYLFMMLLLVADNIKF